MKLPNKRSEVSRSMSSAMREPILRSNAKQEVAATQRFFGMPTNYDDVGNAQARAAQAQGRVGLALADTGIAALGAVAQVDAIQQKVTYDARVSELNSWLAGYAAEEALRQDLGQFDPVTKSYGYDSMDEKFQSEYRQFKEFLGKKYKLTNGALQQEWANVERGSSTEARIRLDRLKRGAMDERVQGDSLVAHSRLSTSDELESWRVDAEKIFPPAKVEELYLAGQDNILIKEYRTKVFGGFGESNSNIEEWKYELDRLMMPGSEGQLGASITAYNRVNTLLKNKRAENNSASIDALVESKTPGEAKAVVAAALETGNFEREDQWIKAGQLQVSDLLVKEARDFLTDDTGQPIDDPEVQSLLAEDIAFNPEVTDADKKKYADDSYKAADSFNRFVIDLAWTSGNKGAAATKADEALLRLDEMSPEELGLKVGDYATKDILMGKMAEHLNQKKRIHAAQTIKLGKDAQDWQDAGQWMSGSMNINPWDTRASDLSGKAFITYVSGKNAENKQFTKPTEMLLADFTKQYKVAPTEAVDQLSYSAITGSPDQAAASLQNISLLNGLTGNHLPHQKGINKDQVVRAINMAHALQGLEGEAFAKALANYKAHELQGNKNSTAIKASYGEFSPRSADSIKEFFKTYAETNGLPVSELSDTGVALVQQYVEEAFSMYNGTESLALGSAVSIALSQMGIENDEYKINSYFAVSAYANQERTDDNPTLKQNIADVAELAGVDPEDVVTTVVPTSQGTNEVIYSDKAGGILINNQTGEVLQGDVNQLSPEAQRLADRVDVDKALDDAQRNLDAKNKQLTQAAPISLTGNRRSQKQREALVVATQSDDQMEAAQAKETIKVMDSIEYQKAVESGNQEFADGIMEEALAHVVAVETARRAAQERIAIENDRITTISEENKDLYTQENIEDYRAAKEGQEITGDVSKEFADHFKKRQESNAAKREQAAIDDDRNKQNLEAAAKKGRNSTSENKGAPKDFKGRGSAAARKKKD
jgi:hypothetical protein